MDKRSSYEDAFLEDVAEQIAYKPLRPTIIKELKDHIEDRAEEYCADGLSRSEAVKKAVDAMGDGVSIGTEINAVRRVRTNRLLVMLTAFFIASGLMAEILLDPYPDMAAYRGVTYYLAGTALLLFTVYKGYPLLIRYQKQLLILAAVLIPAGAVLFQMIQWGIILGAIRDALYFFPFYMLNSYALLLIGPAAVILLYRLRRNGKKAMLAAFLLSAAAMFLPFIAYTSISVSTAVIFLFSMTGTLLYMIGRGVFGTNRKKLWFFAAAGTLALTLVYALLPGQSGQFRTFTNPDAGAYSQWDDAYNGVLIRELLSKAPAAGSISLTPAELMEYGTGEWYFSSGDAQQAAAEGKKPALSQSTFPLHYDESNVTLWNILPQHYRNNYLLAVSILRFGWLPGTALLAAVAAFYAILFTCILKIRGALAGTVSFHCGLCLLLQSLLYVLGNLGFQYGDFTNLPLISEGRISIMFNMLLLGFIYSAYRYDRVIDAPAWAGAA